MIIILITVHESTRLIFQERQGARKSKM